MKSGFSLGLFALALAYTAYGLGTLDVLDRSGRPGAGYFPLIVGVLMVFATAVNAALDLRSRRADAGHATELDPATEATADAAGVDTHRLDGGPRYATDVAIVLAMVCAFIALMPLLGALLAMLLLMLGYLFVFNSRQPVTNVIYSLALPGFLYWLFKVMLGASLPLGPLGF